MSVSSELSHKKGIHSFSVQIFGLFSLCIEGGRGVENTAASSSSSSSDVLGFFVYKILDDADFRKLLMFLRSFLKEHNLHELRCNSFPLVFCNIFFPRFLYEFFEQLVWRLPPSSLKAFERIEMEYLNFDLRPSKISLSFGCGLFRVWICSYSSYGFGCRSFRV